MGLWVGRVAFFSVMWDGESGLENIYMYLRVGLAVSAPELLVPLRKQQKRMIKI